ncbi:MAG TPA: PLP-dependent cysteine synthase family protein [Pyrinomonadaceae bacterium]|nr:PLP-dependent cysteine synthase family protein [Pyrinomonadaceae bacterium]
MHKSYLFKTHAFSNGPAFERFQGVITTKTTIDTYAERLRGLRGMIGNTPLLSIHFTFEGRARVIYAKAEHMNMTGSIKDRMAYHILADAYRRGTLKPGDTIVEATSGNTGISFAALGRALGHPVEIFMPDWMSHERVALIRSLGASVCPVSREQGGFNGSIRLTEQFAANSQLIFLPCQFSNGANVEAHEQTTGPEIWRQLEVLFKEPDAFVAGVGTGGTIMGVGRYLRERRQSIRIHPVEPSESPTLSTGHKVGQHRIQGISDEFIPAIVQLDELDHVVAVNDGDAILMAQKLAADLGLAVGISSGANFIAALKVQNELDDDAVVVTVFADSNKKYLSTDLLREEPVRHRYLAPKVSLSHFEAVRKYKDCTATCGPC